MKTAVPQSSGTFSSCTTETLRLLNRPQSLSCCPQTLKLTTRLSVSLGLSTPGASYTGSHAVCAFLFSRISHSGTSSRSARPAAYHGISFLQSQTIFRCIYVSHFFTLSPVVGHGGCARLLAIVNIDTMTVGMQIISLRGPIFNFFRDSP